MWQEDTGHSHAWVTGESEPLRLMARLWETSLKLTPRAVASW